VPLIDLKFLKELAAGDAGTSIGGTSPEISPQTVNVKADCPQGG
jgi:hypothetical protein